MEVVVLIIVVGILFVLLVKNIQTVEKNQIKIEVDVPHPEKCQEKTMIDFINDTPNYKLEPIYKEYIKKRILLKPIFIEAFNQKLNKGILDITYFYEKIGVEKIEHKKADEKKEAEEKPISLKKWADQNIEKEKITQEDFARFANNKIDSEYLTPIKDIEDTSHYLYAKKVVITGSFEMFPFRNELAHLLWSVGADIDTVVGKKTDVVVLGSQAGWKKMELIEKYQPQVIDQDILMEYFPNYKPKFI